MKKLFLFLLLLNFFACDMKIKTKDKNKSFIYIENNKFKIQDTIFFPIMMNYLVSIRKINNEYVISPFINYEDPSIFEGNTVDSNKQVLMGHLKLIKDIGFNSIRIIGFNNIYYNEKYGNYFTYNLNSNKLDTLQLNDTNQNIYINCIDDIIQIAQELDLKIMLLINGPINNLDYESFIKKILTKFHNNSTIFAYDFFNEPLYFDNINLPPDKMFRPKKEAIKIVKNWKKMMETHAPNQLLTIGFSEPLEVFEWDPELLPVDFVQFHTYHPLRVPNEIYWYAKYINKPCMIGETSLPADDDSISYIEQAQFFNETYKRAVDCGIVGFGWWQFQDMNWGNFEHDYTALMNHSGYTKTSDSLHTINGTLKPVAYQIKKLQKYITKNICPCMVNYYNMLGYHNFMIQGKIIDDNTKEPIEGAVIRGWNKWWGIGQNTFSNEDGIFTLYSNDSCVHFEISAPGMTNTKFDYSIKYEPANKNFIYKQLKNMDLEYHNISYQKFLKDPLFHDSLFSEHQKIFNFIDTGFHNALYIGKMKLIKLKKINY